MLLPLFFSIFNLALAQDLTQPTTDELIAALPFTTCQTENAATCAELVEIRRNRRNNGVTIQGAAIDYTRAVQHHLSVAAACSTLPEADGDHCRKTALVAARIARHSAASRAAPHSRQQAHAVKLDTSLRIAEITFDSAIGDIAVAD